MKCGTVHGHSFCISRCCDLARDRASWEVRKAHGCSLRPWKAEAQVGFSAQDAHRGEPARPDLWAGGGGRRTVVLVAQGHLGCPHREPGVRDGPSELSCLGPGWPGLHSLHGSDSGRGSFQEGLRPWAASPLQPLKVCARGIRPHQRLQKPGPERAGRGKSSPPPRPPEAASVAKTHMGDLCSQGGSVWGHINGAQTFKSPGPGLWGAGHTLSPALRWGHL